MPISFLISELFTLTAVVIALTVHEYCHAYTSDRLGDPTARAFGRLSLNPLRHLDIFGFLCMVIVGFGWAKPVPVNTRHFKNPRKGMALTALAGPLSNLTLSLICALLYKLCLLYTAFLYSSLPNVPFVALFFEYLSVFLYISHFLNLSLALFNLIPLPPLDGSRIIGLILPSRIYYNIMRYERQIYYAFLGWLLLGSYVTRFLLGLPFVAASPVLRTVVSIFSISGWLGNAASFLSSLIFKLLSFIP